MRLGILVLVTLAAVPRLGHAACGDGILDPGEACDPVIRRCCSDTCQRTDADFDGICDDVDVCRTSMDARVAETTLELSGLATPAGDERLRYSGRYKLPAASFVDPATDGFRLGLNSWLNDANGNILTSLLAATIPGGSGWSSRGDRWRYRDPRGRHAGITSIALKRIYPPPTIPADTGMTLEFTITGRRGSYVVTSDMVKTFDVLAAPEAQYPYGWLFTNMALGTAGDGFATCADRSFPSYSVGPTVPCRFDRRQNKIVCGSPPPIGPCRVGEPKDVVICETMAVAAAEEAYLAANGAYFTGDCRALPGYVRTAGTNCALSPAASGFFVNMTYVGATSFTCNYVSSSTPPLTCF